MSTRTVWVNGCFDILHLGHIELLRYAQTLGDRLVVGIDTDERIAARKPGRPIFGCNMRRIMLQSIRYVDAVYTYNSDEELETLIQLVDPMVIVVGSDWKDKPVIGSQYVEDVIFFDRLEQYSTTKTIERLIDRGDVC